MSEVLYDQCGIKLLGGDSNLLLEDLADESIDLIVTDVPYGIGYRSNRAKKGSTREQINVALPQDQDVDARWLDSATRVLCTGGALYLFTRWDVYPQWYSEVAARMQVKNCIVWVKKVHTAGDLKSYGNKHEFILFGNKGRHFPTWDKRETNVWSEASLSSIEHRVHPTQKPLGVVARCIMNSCPVGGVVLDPFCGSGTTLVAAGLLGYRAIGMEIDPQWQSAAVQRLKEMR